MKKKTYFVEFETIITRVVRVKAKTAEDAEQLVKDGNWKTADIEDSEEAAMVEILSVDEDEE